uniref:Reverse transcriptase Ty1/copia-type domain-containing protein n=1 Tax=Trichuris muris TaxID=70415 RepID=A0A5S6QSI6_TRIMR
MIPLTMRNHRLISTYYHLQMRIRPRIIRNGKRGRPRKCYQPAGQSTEHSVTDHIVDTDSEIANIAEIPIEEAMQSHNASEWFDAIKAEILSLIENKSWSIAEKPTDQTIIGSRLILSNKYKSNGCLERRKATLVAKGYSQRCGIDYKETFAPVTRFSSIRTLMALAVERDLKVHQLDITTAFLNGDLEDVFMQIPDFLEVVLESILQERTEPHELLNTTHDWLNQLKRSKYPVCKLKKAIYALKQAGRQWYRKLDHKLRSFGMKPLNADPCIYMVPERNGILKLLVVYVDDTFLLSNDPTWIRTITAELAKQFKLRDLGRINYALGVEFTQNEKEGTITMTQCSYIAELLKRFGMLDCKPAATPMTPTVKLTKPIKTNEQEILKFPYQGLVGSMMYLAVATRPDIAYAVSSLSQSNNNYTAEHWRAAKTVLRYLKGTMDLGLMFHRTGEPICGYADADWEASVVDRKSYTRFVFKLGGAAISWEAKNQCTVALSSTEAEYMGLTEAAKEATHLRHFLEEIDRSSTSAINVYNDNVGAQQLVKNPVFHVRTKHIDIRHHFIREACTNGYVNIKYMQTVQMPADVLTKRLSAPKHFYCLTQLGMKTITGTQSHVD